MKRILIGSNNKDKILVFQRFFEPLGIKIETPDSIGLSNFDPPETGKTFDENALEKAIAFGKETIIPTIADDSGVCIYALGGLPGIKSRRFIPGSDKDRNQYVLKLLSKYEDWEDRSAYYDCSLAFFDPVTKEKFVSNGRCFGTIDFQERGNNGFGYDSIFVPTGFSDTFGILAQSVKDNISHRTKAIENMIPFLKKWIER